MEGDLLDRSPAARIEGRWPETDKVFPKRKPKGKFNVNAKMLSDLLKVATEFSEDLEGKVELLFYGEEDVVELKTKNGKGQEFRGAIMPLTTK